ncbi:hypothetical protein WAI453_003924 [Rhynchosporium graminicola]|uniref:Glycosyltransferase family 92 protein n=1 Tax=Rhynchosporium graminicola TaxID=2792576 RepID=A0A1E1JYE4_9HELO|nr:uncharacterized protein RCO7_06686 [Rhynchosporium commune]
MPSQPLTHFRIFQICLVAALLTLLYFAYTASRFSAFPTLLPPTSPWIPGTKSGTVSAPEEEYVAFCVVHRNQRSELPEFFKHHYHHHGIRRFYIMDDQSTPALSSVVENWGIPRSTLSFQYYDQQAQHQDKMMQTHIYSECARLYGAHHTWMAFVDADEFFEAKKEGETLTSILREFGEKTEVGALGVNWRLHSSANLTKRPNSMRKGFTECVDDPEVLPVKELPRYKDNRLIKSIVKTALFVKPLTPHIFETKEGTHTVGEHGDKIEAGDGIRQPITRDRIALHHYTLKSREQFEEKTKNWSMKGWEYWDHIEGLPQTHCEEMKKYDP